MERIVQGRSATLTHTFYVDGAPTNPTPDAATVTITRADGTAVVTSQTATEAGTGAVTYTLTPVQTALLDTLTVTWTATFGGQPQTFIDIVEVAGDVLFTIADLRAIKPLNNTTDYTTAELTAMRTTVEDAIEEWTGALVPRYALETLSGERCSPLRPGKPFVRSVRSVMVDGIALSGSQLSSVTNDGLMLHGYPWTTGYRNIVVGYEHGRDRPPERLRRAAVLLAKVWLVAGPVDDRTNTFTSTEGGTFSLVTPGRGGSIFGVPEVDAAVQANVLPAVF